MDWTPFLITTGAFKTALWIYLLIQGFRLGLIRRFPLGLDFKRPPTDYEKVGLKLAGSMVPYPARDALNGIGPTATQAVVRVIGQHGVESVAGENAFWVLHYYYRNSSEEFLGLLELLDQDAASAPKEGATHLREAIARYRKLMKEH